MFSTAMMELSRESTAGDIDYLRMCLGKGADVHAPANDGGECFLSVAVTSGCLAAVRLLLSVGADPNHTREGPGDASRPSPVAYAVVYADAEILRALLEAGGDPDLSIQCAENITPLHRLNEGFGAGDAMLDDERLACLRELVAAGADLEKRDSGGRTPLRYFCLQGVSRLPLIEALLLAGADPDSSAPLGIGGRRCIDMLVAGLIGVDKLPSPADAGIVGSRFIQALTAFFHAGADFSTPHMYLTNCFYEGRRSISAVQDLCNLQVQAVVALPPSAHAAHMEARLNALQLFLNAGADPSYVSTYENAPSFWMPPLISAIRANQLRAVELLLAAGAHPAVRVPFAAKHSALDYAIEEPRASVDIVRALLDAGATLAADVLCKTFVDHAARDAERPEKVALLLSLGADPNTLGASGALPLVSAIMAGSPAIVRMLLDAGTPAAAAFPCPTVQLPMLHAAASGDAAQPGLVTLLFEHPSTAALARAQLTTRARYGRPSCTPLSLACYKGHGAAVLELLAAGAAPDAPDSRGVLPLAALRGAKGKGRNQGAVRRAAFKAAVRELTARTSAAALAATPGQPSSRDYESDGELNLALDAWDRAMHAHEASEIRAQRGGGAAADDPPCVIA